MPKKGTKKKSPSPYKNYSVEEIVSAESGNFVIQVGADFFSYKGKIGFNKERAEMFYEDVMAGLHDMKKKGSAIEKEDAMKCLLLLKMYPLRIH